MKKLRYCILSFIILFGITVLNAQPATMVIKNGEVSQVQKQVLYCQAFLQAQLHFWLPDQP